MSDTTSASTVPDPTRRGSRFQFALSTLLLGMFVFAVYFGSAAFWHRRTLAQRETLVAQIDELRAALESERRSHRATQAKLLVVETQLKDALGERLGQQIAGRERAEREQQELSVLAQRLQAENAALRQEIESLRREIESLHTGAGDAGASARTGDKP
jgi:cell division protein FtsB